MIRKYKLGDKVTINREEIEDWSPAYWEELQYELEDEDPKNIVGTVVEVEPEEDWDDVYPYEVEFNTRSGYYLTTEWMRELWLDPLCNNPIGKNIDEEIVL